MNIEIEVGNELFAFDSYEQWVNKASPWFGVRNATIHNTVSIDMQGRICATGKEFSRARDDNAYPIKVYALS